MNKDQLQQELLEKIKEGVKPSDLKKGKTTNISVPPPPPPLPKEKLKPNPYQEKTKQLQEKNQQLVEKLSKLENQSQKPANNQATKKKKTFFCDNCQKVKEGSFAQGSYVKRKVDAPFAPHMHKRVCYICPPCQPYVKEYNEAQDRDKENDPHRQF